MTTRDFRGINYTVQTLTGNNQTFQGTQGNDWIEAQGKNNVISTGKGNDVILAGVEFLSISNYPPYGGPAIVYDSTSTVGNDIIDAGSGDDYVAVGRGNYIVDLGNGNNIFDGSGTTGNIRVSAGNGNDIIDAGIGNYQIDAGGGNNLVYLAAGNASVSTGSGDDVITTNGEGGIGSLLSYVIPEGPGGLQGKPYKQVINAGNGNNQIELPVFGQTSITTGAGQDFVLAISVSTEVLGSPVNTDSVDILTGSGNDTVITVNTKSLIKTGAGDDRVVAGAGDDTIYTGSGHDVINLRGTTVLIPDALNNGFLGATWDVQGGGNDTVYLESGNDKVILGSSGKATIYGFSRNDLLDVSGLNATFTRSGHDTLISSGGNSVGVLKDYTGSVATVTA